MIKVHELTLISMSVTLIIISAQISISMPIGIPLTTQTLVIPLLAMLTNRKIIIYSLFIYILMGLLGFPVFAGFKGGIGILFGPTGGFIFSFIILALFSYLAACKGTKISFIAYLSTGMFLNILLGLLYFSWYTKIHFSEALFTLGVSLVATTILKILLITSIYPVLARSFK